jgi:hypothetical protein
MLERDDDSKKNHRTLGSASAKMKTSIAAFRAVLFAVPAFAQAPGEDASKPVKPGHVRVITRASEPDKWDGQRSANGMVCVFDLRETVP